ncbi:MAG TPA: SDR family NAD(P)-dependent oxidoreductase, partial [Alphaproteobacteria bacterium]|nr:SDR family NAD(P)-dependent oxidoreductase [Alphaproteobacteria bacterium]
MVVIVTGGTQGIGEAVARHAADCGAGGIVLCGRNEERGGAVAADLHRLGCPTEFVSADLERPEDCRAVVAACD